MSDLLGMMLEAAVPMWIERLKYRSWSELAPRCRDLATLIASNGDKILFPGHRPGQTAHAFNALAEAIAICAFAPGGVDAFGRHWEATHPEVSRASTSEV